MKYLKNIFESNEEDIFDLIQEILLPLKDDYPGINGDIKLLNDNSYLIEINITNIRFKGEDNSIEMAKSINLFTSEVLEIIERIEEATNKNVKILNLHDAISLNSFTNTMSDSIKIYLM